MEREITVLTVSQPINVGSGSPRMFAPFFGRSSPFALDDPVVSTLHLRDDDDRFENSIYTPDETGQTLTRPATIGFGATATTLPVGTQLNNFIGSIMEDSHGNRFAMILPRISAAALRVKVITAIRFIENMPDFTPLTMRCTSG